MNYRCVCLYEMELDFVKDKYLDYAVGMHQIYIFCWLGLVVCPELYRNNSISQILSHSSTKNIALYY